MPRANVFCSIPVKQEIGFKVGVAAEDGELRAAWSRHRYLTPALREQSQASHKTSRSERPVEKADRGNRGSSSRDSRVGILKTLRDGRIIRNSTSSQKSFTVKEVTPGKQKAVG